jgi:hypothetical protein
VPESVDVAGHRSRGRCPAGDGTRNGGSVRCQPLLPEPRPVSGRPVSTADTADSRATGSGRTPDGRWRVPPPPVGPGERYGLQGAGAARHVRPQPTGSTEPTRSAAFGRLLIRTGLPRPAAAQDAGSPSAPGRRRAGARHATPISTTIAKASRFILLCLHTGHRLVPRSPTNPSTAIGARPHHRAGAWLGSGAAEVSGPHGRGRAPGRCRSPAAAKARPAAAAPAPSSRRFGGCGRRAHGRYSSYR